MIAWRNQYELIGREWERLQVSEVNQIDHNADIGEASPHRLYDFVARPLFEFDINISMACQEASERFGEEFGRGDRIGQQPHVSLEAVRVFSQFPPHPLELLQHDMRVVNQRMAGGVSLTPRGWRSSRGTPSTASIPRIRALADARAILVCSAP